VPEEHSDDAEAVAELARSLVENATKAKPNKKMFEITAEGLKKAATNIAAITPPVLATIQAILSFIEKLPR
jgi:ADP-ribosylglycohydrolase